MTLILVVVRFLLHAFDFTFIPLPPGQGYFTAILCSHGSLESGRIVLLRPHFVLSLTLGYIDFWKSRQDKSSLSLIKRAELFVFSGTTGTVPSIRFLLSSDHHNFLPSWTTFWLVVGWGPSSKVWLLCVLFLTHEWNQRIYGVTFSHWVSHQIWVRVASKLTGATLNVAGSLPDEACCKSPVDFIWTRTGAFSHYKVALCVSLRGMPT